MMPSRSSAFCFHYYISASSPCLAASRLAFLGGSDWSAISRLVSCRGLGASAWTRRNGARLVFGIIALHLITSLFGGDLLMGLRCIDVMIKLPKSHDRLGSQSDKASSRDFKEPALARNS